MNFKNTVPPRQSARIKENHVFFNIYGVENEGSLTSPPAVVYKFERELAKSIDFSHEMEAGNLKYAPSLRNAYYMSVPGSMLSSLTGDSFGMPQWATEARHVKGKQTEPVIRRLPDVAIRSFFYISLKFLDDLANDEVDWMSLSCLEDPQVTCTSSSKATQEAETLKEIAFAGLGDPPKKDPVDKLPYDPPITKPKVRAKYKSKKKKKMEIEEESKEQELPPHLANKSSSSPSIIDWATSRREITDEIAMELPRRVYIPIRHQNGWLIWIRRPNWNLNREERRGQLAELKKAFEEVWMANTATDPESAAGYRPRYSSADLCFPLYVVPQHDNLTLRLGWQTTQIQTLFRALVEKIDDERSQPKTRLIPTTESQVILMGLVKMGENPFGLFTTYISAVDFNNYMKGLETLTGTDQTLVKRDANRIARTSGTDLMIWLERHYNPMITRQYTPPQKAVLKLIKESKNQSAKAIPVEDPLYVEEASHGSTWSIKVSREKMKVAGGKRVATYAPNSIMGMSANQAAEDGFGWSILDQAQQCLGHQHRLTNGMYMAEWLHMCAFSWGGLSASPKSTNLIYRTSDIPNNLVLGTSETNSVMTRFEKAWQALVRDASDSASDSAGNSTFYARLVVSRNRNTEPVMWDLKDAITNSYYRKEEASMSQTEIEIAEKFHFVAYTVSYAIEFPEGCRMLSMGSGEGLKTTFYPFLRPLYHRLEDQLDQALYEEIKTGYSADDISNRLRAAMSGIGPVVTDGQTLYDGTTEYTTQGGGIRRKGISKYPHNTQGKRKKGAGVKADGKLGSKVKDH